MRIGIVAVAAALLTAPPAGSLQQREDPEVLLQAALKTETVQGDLDTAARLYMEIITRHGSNKGVAARALVRLGECYEKLGDDKARKAYERVLRDYADQEESVRAARSRLAAITPGTWAPSAGPSVRLLWAEKSTDVTGGPSPDGRYLTFVDWETGDLAVRDLKTGHCRRLTNKGSFQQSQEFALYSAWSPDGKTIAYEWYNAKGDSELRLIRPDGTGMSVLFRPSKARPWIELAEWAPDGKSLLVLVSVAYGPNSYEHEDYVAIASVPGGEIRPLLKAKVPVVWLPRFSPDGNRILINRETADGSTDIVLLSVDGKPTTPVVVHPANDRAVGWHPSGKFILFASDRKGTLDLYALRIENGLPRDEPVRILANMPGEQTRGFTREGTLILGRERRNRDIYTVGLDPSSGKALGQPALFVTRFEGVNEWPAYSHDESRLAFITSRGALQKAPNQGDTLTIMDVASRKTREYPTEFAGLYKPLWLSEKSIMLVASRTIEDIGIYTFNLDSGQSDRILGFRRGDLTGNDVSPGRQELYYSRRDVKRNVCEVVARGIRDGSERLLHSGPAADFYKLALSPDGKLLALLNRAEERIIRVVPVAGGPAREVARFKHLGNHILEIGWSSDGQYLLVPRTGELLLTPSGWSLWRFRLSDGVGEVFVPKCGRVTKTTMPRDGRALVYATVGRNPQPAEIWAVDGFVNAFEKRSPKTGGQ